MDSLARFVFCTFINNGRISHSSSPLVFFRILRLRQIQEKDLWILGVQRRCDHTQ